MINAPKPGTPEYYLQREEETRDVELQKEFLTMRQNHEWQMKNLELQVTKQEVSLKASLKMLLVIFKLPFFFLAILPITLMVLFRRTVPPNLWKILEL